MTEGRALRSKLLMYGCEKGRMPIELDTGIIKVGRMLLELPANTVIDKNTITKEKMVENSKKFISVNFKMHDVPYMEIERAKKIGTEFDKNQDLEWLLKSLEEEMHLVSPYDLPIKFTSGHSMVGRIFKPIIIIPNDDYLKRAKITFEEITLGDNITDLSSATYIHELTHTQLESVRGSFKNYHHKELISILLEKIAAYELEKSGKLLEKSEQMRFRDLLEHIATLNDSSSYSRTDLVEASVYVTSILKAQNLFDKYLESNEEEKQKMIAKIQNIWDGILTVEELLDIYDVTLVNSCDSKIIKKHLVY